MNCDINKKYIIDKYKCDSTDEDYCHIMKNNTFLQQMLIYINRLNCYIHSQDVDYSKYNKVIDKLYSFLLKRNNFIKDRYLWIQLHSRYVDTYNNVENIGNINIYKMTKHNYAVAPFINEMLKTKNINLLIHFDTHSDMNPLKKYKKVNKLFDTIVKKDEVVSSVDKLEKLIWDIGMPVSGFIAFWNKINKSNDLKILWTVPAWIPINAKEPIEHEIDTLFSSRDIYLTTDGKSDTLDYTMNKTKNNISSFHMKRLKFKNSSNWKQVLEYINNNNFILDIDLDYFVSNGTNYNYDYINEYHDVRSHYRTTLDTKIIHDTPRGPFDKDSDFNKYEKQVIKEVKEINNRMKYFLRGIKYLKNKGKIPISIIICDSTSAHDSIITKCHTHHNEYVPNEYALWIHKTILNGLYEIYS